LQDRAAVVVLSQRSAVKYEKGTKMNLDSYFQNVKGVGILATSDADGNVDAAIYAKPYVIDEKIIAFSMLEHTSYSNVMANLNACFLFIEKGEGFKGYRFYLQQKGEETDPDNIKMLKKTHNIIDMPTDQKRHLVYFRIKQVRPLIDDKK
jgi:hypothetical protein